MASIVELVNKAAGNNGGRIPRGFIPKVIQQFASVAPGLTRDQINTGCRCCEFADGREHSQRNHILVMRTKEYVCSGFFYLVLILCRTYVKRLQPLRPKTGQLQGLLTNTSNAPQDSKVGRLTLKMSIELAVGRKCRSPNVFVIF
jgi:hypothetical protein